MFGYDGSVKVGDFGLVTAVNPDGIPSPCDESAVMWDKNSDSHTDKVGTHLYMSPEQVNNVKTKYNF